MSDKYTNNELGLLLQGTISKIDQFMHENHEQHNEMHGTLKEHNGRLRTSEKAVLTLKVMISTAVGIFVIIVLPIMVWYAKSVSASVETLKSEINQLK